MIKNNPDMANFELVVYKRDSKGNPTNQKISHQSNSGYGVAQFYGKNVVAYRQKKGTSIPGAEEADKILRDMYND
jgi:spermidine/putrescine-binding protein